jgi:hypothetical protein
MNHRYLSAKYSIERTAMHDIIDVIKNLQTLSENNSAFKVLKDFERVIDELDVYVFKNWEEGELIEGPKVNRYDVTCKFMWPREDMPDPKGGKRLVDHGCQVIFAKEEVLLPRKIKDPSDYRPGTRKGKIDSHPIWTVEITMPKKLMQDVYIGKENKETNRMAELMKYSQGEVAPDSAATQTEQEPAADVQS